MPSIFVSYRRSDAPAHAGRIYDRLVDRFGSDELFKDLDSTAPGSDFVEAIESALGRCDVCIAVIGQNWLPPARGLGGVAAREGAEVLRQIRFRRHRRFLHEHGDDPHAPFERTTELEAHPIL